MAVKRKIVQKTKEVEKYDFFCDLCGDYIGSSEEYDDGYCPDPPEVKRLDISIYAFGKWLNCKRILCKNCLFSQETEIIRGLKTLGFEEEQEGILG